jgi:hypothetical protein
MPHQLTYVSTIRPNAAAILASTVQDILVESAPRNRRDDITGFLLADGESFVQLLEGPERAVEDCFLRILLDYRHHKIVLRERGPVERRLFPAWSMCGLTLSSVDDTLLHPPDLPFDLQTTSTGALIQLLASLAERHGPELDARHAHLLVGARL